MTSGTITLAGTVNKLIDEHPSGRDRYIDPRGEEATTENRSDAIDLCKNLVYARRV